MSAIRLYAALLAIGSVLGTVALSHGAPPAGQPVNPDMHRWFESLKQPGTGAGCCSVADCRPYDSRVVDNHYEILLQQKWLPVPHSVVLHQQNKAGAAIACLRTQWNYGFGPPPADYDPEIMCFIPGPEV